MGIMNKYNGNSKIEWGVNTDGFEYKKLSELDQNAQYPVKGCFITKDVGFGKGAVLITDSFFASLPERYVGVVSKLMGDEEAVALIKEDKVKFTVSEFMSDKFNRKGYRIAFIEEE